MSEAPSSLTGRRTRRARRVGIDQYDAMSRANADGRSSVDPSAAILPDSAPPDQDAWPAEERQEQPTPGAPTNSANDLEVPYEQQFAGRDFLPAPGLRRVALALITRDQHLRNLTDVHVEYLWRRRGGQTRGQPHIGEAVLPSGLAKHAWNAMARAMTGSSTETVTFVVWLAADHLAEYTSLQVEASLYRQLLKCTGTDARDHSKRKLRSPNLVGFREEILRYGLWTPALVEAAPAFRAAVASNVTNPSFDSLLETTSLAVEQNETTTQDEGADQSNDF